MTSIKRFCTPELPQPLSTPARATRLASTLLAAGMLAFVIAAPAGGAGGGHRAMDHHLGRDAGASLGRGTASAVQCA